MADNRLTLRFTAQNDATKAFTELKGQMTGLERSAQNLGNVFKLLAGAAIFGGLVKAGNDAVQAASAVAEAQNKANQVFGDAIGVVNQLALVSAQSLGQTKAAVLDTAGSLGAFMKNAGMSRDAAADMSVALIRLSSDMASFHNADPSEMLTRIRSGLAGEVEPLRRYGIDLSATAVQQEAVRMGLSRLGDELNQNQKLQAAYSLIMRQSADVHGDFARTADGLANSQRSVGAAFVNIQANVASAFLPTIEVVMGRFKELVFNIEEWTRDMPKNVAIWLMELQIKWIEASYGVASAVNAMAQGVEAGFQVIRGAIKAVAGALAGLLGAVGSPAMMAMIPGLGQAAAFAAPAMKAFADSIDVTGTSMADLQTKSKWIKDDMGRDILQVIQDTDQTITRLGEASTKTGAALDGNFTPPMQRAAGAAQVLKKSLEELLAAALALDAAMPDIEAMVAGDDLLGAAQRLVDLGESAESAVGKVISIMKSLREDAKRAADDAAAAAKKLADDLAAAAQKAAEAWKARSDEMARSIIDALKAGKDWAVGTAKFFENEWLASLEATIAEVAQQIRNALRDGLDITDIVKGATPLFDAYKAAVAAIKAQADGAKKALDELAEAQRHNAQMAQEWIRQMTINADFEFQRNAQARKEGAERQMFGKTLVELQHDADVAVGIQRNAIAALNGRNAARNENAVRAGAASRVDALGGMLGGPDAPGWWVNGLRDALRDTIVRTYLDGKDVSRGVSARQQDSSFLLSAMGGFA